MGLKEQISGPADRLHEFVGRDATVVNHTIRTDENGDWITDDYGDPERDETELEVAVEVSARGSVSFERRLSGVDSDAVAVIWLPADIDVYDGGESDEHSPTQIHVGTDSYQVIEVTTEETGRKRCHCDRL